MENKKFEELKDLELNEISGGAAMRSEAANNYGAIIIPIFESEQTSDAYRLNGHHRGRVASSKPSAKINDFGRLPKRELIISTVEEKGVMPIIFADTEGNK